MRSAYIGAVPRGAGGCRLRLRKSAQAPFEPDPGHAGEGTGASSPADMHSGSPAQQERPMNKPFSPADLVTPKVTTGPICGSRKIYTTPDAAVDLRVPFREIALDPSA